MDVTSRVVSRGGRHWFRFVADADQDFVGLEIGSVGGESVVPSELTWPRWMALRAAWDDRERLWVASADTGVAVFVLDGAAWRRYAWEPGIDAAGRPPMQDLATGESVSWLMAEPPAELHLR